MTPKADSLPATGPAYAVIGIGGFVAPRHLRAIRDTGGRVVAGYDPHDSVGIIDSYFPETHFFTEFERFDRHIDKLRRAGSPVDYVTICSPNYLHDAHVRFALRSGAHAICEKPLVLNPWNLDPLEALAAESGRSINAILQLRLHPAIRALRDRFAATERPVEVELTYVTPRGRWYHSSWKGDEAKSGGVVTNIGLHLFDMLAWVFGAAVDSRVHARAGDHAAGELVLERALVRWFLSTNPAHLPPGRATTGDRVYRGLRIGVEEFNFTDGFHDLHTASYREIVAGRGFTVADARPGIELAYAIRTAGLSRPAADCHPLCRTLPDS
jgi:UDP-N-acetyl-2-amino-2-deoxyglucuronate dehydrogenase